MLYFPLFDEHWFIGLLHHGVLSILCQMEEDNTVPDRLEVLTAHCVEPGTGGIGGKRCYSFNMLRDQGAQVVKHYRNWRVNCIGVLFLHSWKARVRRAD